MRTQTPEELKLQKWLQKTAMKKSVNPYGDHIVVKGLAIIEHEEHDPKKPGFVVFDYTLVSAQGDWVYIQSSALKKLVKKCKGSGFSIYTDGGAANELVISITNIDYDALMEKLRD